MLILWDSMVVFSQATLVFEAIVFIGTRSGFQIQLQPWYDSGQPTVSRVHGLISKGLFWADQLTSMVLVHPEKLMPLRKRYPSENQPSGADQLVDSTQMGVSINGGIPKMVVYSGKSYLDG